MIVKDLNEVEVNELSESGSDNLKEEIFQDSDDAVEEEVEFEVKPDVGERDAFERADESEEDENYDESSSANH